jgi:prolyl-tRNA synthetase
MRGNDELNETKLEAIFKTNKLRPADSAELIKYTGADHGSIGPINLKTKMKVIADNLLKDANGLVSGANKDGFHLKNIDFTRDCTIEEYHDLRTIKPGEPDIIDGSPLRVVKAIELGHIFKLGTKYSDALGANFLDEQGNENPIIMGSYGIGVERILACFIEQSHDEKGIIWKAPLTPFHVHLIGLNLEKFDIVREACEKIYADFTSQGIDVLFDDRNDSAGVKFNDADLLGIPLQIIVGKKNIEEGKVEVKIRETGERKVINISEIKNFVNSIYSL